MLTGALLGEQAIVGPDGVSMRSSRSVALLAFLAWHAGVPQPRHRVAVAFWPDSSDAQALTNLRRELHALRRVLGSEGCLQATATDLTWVDVAGVELDLRVFEAAAAAAFEADARGDAATACAQAELAIARYRGELLPGLYDEWALEARAAVEQRCVDLCDLASRLHRAAGDLAAAVATARRRIELRPLEESGYRTLMELQAQVGDPAAAVSTYHRCASMLERELGVQPDRETSELLRRIMPRRAEPSGRDAAPAGSGGGPDRGAGRTGRTRARTGAAAAGVADRGRGDAAGLPRARSARGRQVAAGHRTRRGVPPPTAPSSSPPAASAPPADAPSNRSPTGCATPPSRPRSEGWTRCGAAKSTGCCRAQRGRARRPRRPSPTPGSGTGSSRAWPAACSRSGGHCSWCSTTRTGATRSRCRS